LYTIKLILKQKISRDLQKMPHYANAYILKAHHRHCIAYYWQITGILHNLPLLLAEYVIAGTEPIQNAHTMPVRGKGAFMNAAITNTSAPAHWKAIGIVLYGFFSFIETTYFTSSLIPRLIVWTIFLRLIYLSTFPNNCLEIPQFEFLQKILNWFLKPSSHITKFHSYV